MPTRLSKRIARILDRIFAILLIAVAIYCVVIGELSVWGLLLGGLVVGAILLCFFCFNKWVWQPWVVPWFIRKFGQPVTEEQLKGQDTLTPLTVAVMTAFMAVCFGVTFVLMKFFIFSQELLLQPIMNENAVLLKAHALAFDLPALFMGPILCYVLLTSWINRFGQDHPWYRFYYQGYRPSDQDRKVIRIFSTVVVIAGLILLVLGLNNYAVIGKEGIRINRYFSFQEEYYSWNDVQRILRVYARYDKKKEFPYYRIEFNNGRLLYPKNYTIAIEEDMILQMVRERSKVPIVE